MTPKGDKQILIKLAICLRYTWLEMCAIAYIFIYRKRPVNVLFYMLAIGMYWDLIVIGGGIGRVENLWLTTKLNSTVTMTVTVLITQDFFRE